MVVVDDHSIFARGLELLLSAASEGRIRVAGRTEDAGEAIELVRREHPHVAIVDLAMPPPGGQAAIAEIAGHYPAVRILALSGTESRHAALAALAAGAHAFIPKSSNPEVLVPPLLSLGAGLSVVPEPLLRELIRSAGVESRAVLSGLDPDDIRLWQLLARGQDSHEIAEQVFVSERTAKRMVAALLRKIGVANRIEAAVLAGRIGLLDEQV
ncbi:MAG: response regulator transcription factor [Acidimicrobiia bacterium]